MSNYLAIATATAALKALLHERAVQDVNGADVITMRPEDAVKQTGSKINIYLYQVTPNAAWRNADVPTRRADGTVLQRPLAALDLHYMISCYGPESDFVSQRLLGSVVRTLHAEPQLTRDRLQRVAQTVRASDGNSILAASNLADQIELVKFSPLHLSLEDLAKIWSVFYQIPYALSVAYQASVVLIESEDTPPASALPVRTRNVYAVPFQQPIIEQIVVKPDANQLVVENTPVTVDKILLVRGKHLQGGNGILLQLGDVEIIPTDVKDTEITLDFSSTMVPLPDSTTVPLTDFLQAGVQGLQVLQRMQMGADKTNDQVNWHRGVESNVAAFVLRPKIMKSNGQGGEITVTLQPAVSKGQRVTLLLNELMPQPLQSGRPVPAAYAFNADASQQTWKTNQAGLEVSDTITFTTAVVKPATTYLIRVQVDGAESLLDVDPDPQSPTFNRYLGTPKVVVP